jgi:hypothetical protein
MTAVVMKSLSEDEDGIPVNTATQPTREMPAPSDSSGNTVEVSENETSTLAQMRGEFDPRLVVQGPTWRELPLSQNHPGQRSQLAACYDSLERAERRRKQRNTIAVQDSRGRSWGIVDGGVMLGGLKIAVELTGRQNSTDAIRGSFLPRFDACDPDRPSSGTSPNSL